MRVICIDDGPEAGFPSGLTKWREYTIVGECPYNWFHDNLGVIIAEVKPPNANTIDPSDGLEWCNCYRSTRFAPIREFDVNAMFRCDVPAEEPVDE